MTYLQYPPLSHTNPSHIYVFNNHQFQNHPAFSPYKSQAPAIKAWKDGQNDQRCHEERPRDQLMMPGQPGGTILIQSKGQYFAYTTVI